MSQEYRDIITQSAESDPHMAVMLEGLALEAIDEELNEIMADLGAGPVESENERFVGK